MTQDGPKGTTATGSLVQMSVSEGGIPMYRGSDVTVLNKSKLNFDGLQPSANKVALQEHLQI
eukprot:4084580-Amphidinium_carterae.1